MEPQFFEVRDGNNNQYRTFISNLRQTLANISTHGVPALIPVPPPNERGQRVPIQFFDLVLRANDRSVTFRLRRDNLYLIGYQMENGQWLEFDNEDGTHLIREQGTAFLGFGGSYLQLERAAHMSRDNITVGSPALRNAIDTLATSENGADRASSLMIVVVMFPEAIRLIQVRDFIAQNYVQGARIRDDENLNIMQQIHNWGQFSEAMFLMDAFPQEGPVVRRWGIRQIVERMGIALNFCQGQPRVARAITTLQDEDGGGGQCYAGLPLVEVFSVSIVNNNVNVDSHIHGTIAITDALRTQLIYNRSRDNPDYINADSFDILLTGPYDAVSGLGDFTIKFLLHDKARNDGVIIDEEINWNFYDFGNVYDRLISKQLSMGISSLIINYAVFGNAVAAKVSILKFEGGDNKSEVYGKVSSSISLDGAETTIVLFHRERDDYITVNRGEGIPFSRSVIVVPLSSSAFTVKAELYDSNWIFDEKLANATITFHPKISGSDVMAIEGDYSVALMSVNWVRAF